MRSRASRRRLSDNDIRCSASDRRWFPARPAQHVDRRCNHGKAEYHRHSRARMAETAKDASRRATPDAPERIDHRRRRTRHDHRTCCRGSRGSASLPCHTLRKRVSRDADTPICRPADTLPLPTAHFERNDVTIICETVHHGFFAEMESIPPHSGSNPRLLCLTNVYFGQEWREQLPGSTIHI